MKKTNAKKKLIPAAAMLAISAAMLSTATYAWFTMSRNVEVKGINMTATVPAGLQISLGNNMGSSTTGDKLTAINSTAADGVGLVKAPINSDTSTDWANSVQFNRWYVCSKLNPASSDTGNDIFYTDKVTVVGKTLDEKATSYSAIEASKSAVLTLGTAKNSAPDNTSAAGYYVDFPVWFRSAESNDINLGIVARVSKGDNTTGAPTETLYKAARVSILKYDSTNSKFGVSDGVIIPYDGDTANQGTYYQRADKGNSSTDTNEKAIKMTGTNNGVGSIFGDVDKVTQNHKSGAETIVTVPGKDSSTDVYDGLSTDASTNYGKAICVMVRVWLEGEDESCWNATAGQDFNIELHFEQVSDN